MPSSQLNSDVLTQLEEAKRAYTACEYTTALQRFLEAVEQIQLIGDNHLLAYAVGHIGIIYRIMGKNYLAVRYLEDAYELLPFLKKEDAVPVSRNLGIVYNILEDPEKAQKVLYKTLSELKEPEDNLSIVALLTSLSAVYSNIEDYETSLNLEKRAIQICRDMNYEQGIMTMLANLAITHGKSGENELALECCYKALSLLDNETSPAYDKANVYIIVADMLFANGQIEEAIRFASLSSEVAKQNSLGMVIPMALNVQMRYCMVQGKFDEAIKFGLEAEAATEDKFRSLPIYLDLAEAYKSDGNYESAYTYLYKHADLRLKLVNEERQKIILEMQARFEVEMAQKEQERLRSELKFKESELSTFALQLVEKRELLSTAVERLRKVEAIESKQKELRSIINDFTEVLREERSWDVLEQQFNQIHGNFLPNLLKQYPTLTPVESRICMLTRLNFETKQIASLLSIDPRTVQNHRLSIRRKLNVRGKENLTAFLASLS